MRRLIAVVLLALAACGGPEDTLKVGGKDFSESRILSEMIAALAEESGIAVTRRVGLGSTLLNLESLKRGDIDVYPEYNGTGLVMLGQPALADGDAAMERVRALYEPLGLVWGERIGFANNYGLAMSAARAEALGVRTISDLIGEARDLTIGLDEEFASRPLDGFEALVARYGMSFGEVAVVSPGERATLYDRLLAGEADVIEVFTTDAQIAEQGLAVLEDDLDFFPVYQAAPLIRADAVLRFPALRTALDRLAGAIDAATMRRLNAQVDLDALAPRAVARAALAEMGLLDISEDLDISVPLVVATSPLLGGDAETGRTLRAVREAFPGRRVTIEAFDDPLGAVSRGAARLALVSAADFAAVDAAGTPVARPFEGLGVVGQGFVHVVALAPGLRNLRDATTLATGPEGSSSYDAGAILAAGIDGIVLVPLPPQDFVAAARAAGADAALVLAPLGGPAAVELAAAGRLLPISGWEQGNNLVRFPHLREARIPEGTYPGQSRAVETLAAQLVLAGPVVEDDEIVGPQGPGASAPTPVSRLPDATVLALDAALGTGLILDPAIAAAPALAPQLPAPPAAINPSPAISAMTLAVLALFGWLTWLYGRPQRR